VIASLCLLEEEEAGLGEDAGGHGLADDEDGGDFVVGDGVVFL